MADEVKPVVEPVAGAGGAASTEIDWEVRYKEQTDRLSKAEKAAADWRTSYRAAKKAADAGSEDAPDQVELMRQVAQEVLMTSTVEQERKNLETLNLTMARELKEARTALGAKAGMSSASMGSGQGGTPEVKSIFFSEAQIAELKKRGFTDEMIKTTVQRAAR